MYCPPPNDRTYEMVYDVSSYNFTKPPFGSSYKFTFDTLMDYTQLHIKQDLR